jgi:DNA-binding SARP family transcriptional activator/tetratricopeptide (TPR) repeat protein
MASLLIRTFGPLSIELTNGGAAISRHASGLLAYLGTRLDKPVPRDLAASLLWETSNSKKGRHSLSQLIYNLKSQLPVGCLIVDSHHVMLKSQQVRSDYSTFAAAVRSGDHLRVLDTYVGSFLEKMPFLTDAYDDWRIDCAAAAEADAISACVALITGALDQDDNGLAGDIAKRGLSIDPSNEYFARIRIEALASSGDVSAALRELESAKSRLLITTGAIPESLTGTLASRIACLPVLTDQRVSVGISTRLVGRTREVRDLRAQWELAKSSFRVAIIRGEPGIGKSRLMQHTIRWAVLDGARSYMYSSSEVESRLPCSTIVGLIRDGFRPTDGSLLEHRWQQALGALAPEVLPSSSPASESPRILWEAIARYFALVSARSPVVISVDDFHWTDDESKEILVYIQKRLPDSAIFLLTAGRGAVRPPAYEDDEAQTRVLDLEELSPTDTYELLDEFEKTYRVHIDESTRRLLIGGVGGRPFFLVEALRHLRDCGDSLSASTVVGDLMSPSIEAYLGRRFADLSANAQAIAAIAAVLNRDIPLHLVARVAGVSVINAAEGVDELVRSGIMAEATTIRFAHALMREVGLAALPQSQRRLWHLRIATALIDLDAARTSEIAYHLEEGGDYEAAFSFADEAASEALRVRAYSDAEEQYGRMLRCGHGVQVTYAQGAYLKFLSRFDRFNDVQHSLPSLEAYFRKREDYEGMVVCAIARYWVAEKQGHLDWQESIARAKDIVEMAERYTPQKITSVLWQVADAIRRSGEFAVLGRFAHLLEERSREPELDPNTAAEMLAIAALLAGSSEGHILAMELAEQAVSIAEAVDDPTVVIRTLYARGTARFWSGNVQGARSDYDRVLSKVDTFAPDDLVGRVKSNYSVVLMEQGEYQLAEEFAQATLREAGMVRRSYAFGNLALIHLRRGDYTAARKYVLALLAANEASPQAWIRMHAEALLGLADLAIGDIEAARLRANVVAGHHQSTDGIVDSSHIYMLRSRIAVLDGDWSTGVHVLTEGIEAIAHKEVIAGARLEIELASALFASGDGEHAREICGRVARWGREGAAWSVVAAAEALLEEIARQPEASLLL